MNIKRIYALVFIAVLLVLIYCMGKAAKKKNELARSIAGILLFAAAATGANLVFLLSTDKFFCRLGYGIFFASIDGLLLFLARYCCIYTGTRIKNKYLLYGARCLLAIDAVSMLLDPFFHHVISLKMIEDKGEEYVRIISHTPYQLHLILSYFMVAACIYTLVRKTIISAAIYRRKYEVVLVALLIVVAFDAVFVFSGLKVDISILFFAFSGIAVYYYSLVFVPKGVMNDALAIVVREMKDAVIFLDHEGKCIYINHSAEELFAAEHKTHERIEEEFKEWAQKKGQEGYANFVIQHTIEREGRKLYFKIQFRRLLDSREKYIGGFFVLQDNTRDYEQLQREQYLARHDSFTGLYNKHYFYKKVQEEILRQRDKEFLIICSNVRQFKLVNDVFGTEAGDEILLSIAEEMRTKARPGMIYGRLESDKFAVCMEKKCYEEEKITLIPGDIIKSTKSHIYPFYNYMGIYEVREREIPVSVMCDRAFMAIGTIRDDYHQRVAYYDDVLRESVLQNQKMVAQIPKAIEEGQFEVYLQPQLDYATGNVFGGEALIRWNHPQKGMIPPGKFIHVLEESGLITRVDQFIWEQACRYLHHWKEMGIEDMSISVNISPKDFYFVDLYQVFTGLVEKYQISPSNLKLEITETAIMQDVEKQVELIKRLQQVGFIVEMDDFGSGYSSLNTLKDIPVNVLKMDMAFLGETKDEERGRKILKMTVGIAKELEVPVIAEGVETKEQAEYLYSVGCHWLQGYYIAKPMSVGEFEKEYVRE